MPLFEHYGHKEINQSGPPVRTPFVRWSNGSPGGHDFLLGSTSTRRTDNEVKIMRTMANLCWGLAVLGVVGCGGAPDPTDVGTNEPVGQTEQAYTYSPYRGGQGGSPKWTGWGNFNGFKMSCGSYVDALTFYSGPTSTFPFATGTGGIPRSVFLCPAGQFLLGMWGKTDGVFINKLSFICGTPNRSVFTYLYDFCGSTESGQVFIDACPQGQIVRGVSGRAGSWVDGIQIYCDVPGFNP
jgi:hypothetical protein